MKNSSRYAETRRLYYLNNKEKIKAVRLKRRTSKRASLNALKAKPCVDCQQQYPHYVMDFDHLDPQQKQFNIGTNWGSHSLPELTEEISRCELVCANCHRQRTWERLHKTDL